jgi:hypothetical protein
MRHLAEGWLGQSANGSSTTSMVTISNTPKYEHDSLRCNILRVPLDLLVGREMHLVFRRERSGAQI